MMRYLFPLSLFAPIVGIQNCLTVLALSVDFIRRGRLLKAQKSKRVKA